MSARDKYHAPYHIPIGSRRGFIDLGAERPLAAEKEGRRIAVEIKSFLGASEMDDLENALGQFGIYRVILAKRDPMRTLYLALPEDIRTLLQEGDFMDILGAFHARLIFFDPQLEVISAWIETTPIERL